MWGGDLCLQPCIGTLHWTPWRSCRPAAGPRRRIYLYWGVGTAYKHPLQVQVNTVAAQETWTASLGWGGWLEGYWRMKLGVCPSMSYAGNSGMQGVVQKPPAIYCHLSLDCLASAILRGSRLPHGAEEAMLPQSFRPPPTQQPGCADTGPSRVPTGSTRRSGLCTDPHCRELMGPAGHTGVSKGMP